MSPFLSSRDARRLEGRKAVRQAITRTSPEVLHGPVAAALVGDLKKASAAMDRLLSDLEREVGWALADSESVAFDGDRNAGPDEDLNGSLAADVQLDPAGAATVHGEIVDDLVDALNRLTSDRVFLARVPDRVIPHETSSPCCGCGASSMEQEPPAAGRSDGSPAASDGAAS